jgi:hypothetical protein
MSEVVARALAAVCPGASVLECLGGPIGEAARRAFHELAGLSSAVRSERRAAWAAIARAHVPAGLRGVDPSWIEAGLAGLPLRARGALAGASDPISVWLARLACANIPPLVAIDPTIRRPRSIQQAVAMDGKALAGWLEGVGEDQLAFAIGAAGSRALSAASAQLGHDLTEVARRITEPPRRGELGQPRAAIARCRVVLDSRARLLVGARAIAPRTDPITVRQLGLRLALPLGELVISELLAYADDPVDAAPSWQALSAP